MNPMMVTSFFYVPTVAPPVAVDVWESLHCQLDCNFDHSSSRFWTSLCSFTLQPTMDSVTLLLQQLSVDELKDILNNDDRVDVLLKEDKQVRTTLVMWFWDGRYHHFIFIDFTFLCRSRFWKTNAIP